MSGLTAAFRRLLAVREGTAVQRVLLGALAFESALVLAGVALAPETARSGTGLGIVVADLGLLVLIYGASVLGPSALDRYPEIGGICLSVGVAFAVAYDAELLLDFAGRPVSVNPYALFVAGALVASGWATARSRRLTRGVAAGAWSLVIGTSIWSIGLMTISYAYWRTPSGYGFWLRDGAVSDFRHSGGTDLWLFLLQDIEGAVFFHPLLSLALGATLGAAGALGMLGAVRLTDISAIRTRRRR